MPNSLLLKNLGDIDISDKVVLNLGSANSVSVEKSINCGAV